ncbi:MAG: hypothetical protein WCK61_06445 [Candidatus Omnitrophota bacterium]
MFRKVTSLILMLVFVISMSGCTTMLTPEQKMAKSTPEQETAKPTPEQEVVKYVGNFDYTPDSQGSPGSAGVTFAIEDFHYAASNVPSEIWIRELVAIKKADSGKLLWFLFPQFDNLIKASKDDLSKILVAKGFGIRGPFDSYDLIPYSDKKAIDLHLVPTLELSFKLKDEKWTEMNYITGNVEVNGKIILALKEIATGELMWTKSIPLEKIEFSYSVRSPYNVERKFDLIMNDAAKGIERQYPGLMATISKLIDPEEMRIIKKQCQELKSKKGY